MCTHIIRATPLSAVGLRAAATVIEAPSSRLRWALAAVVVLATVLMGCNGGSERVYDDTTLRLTAYATTQPGEVLLVWTGGPPGFRRWEYSTRIPGFEDDPVWRDVPLDRAPSSSRQLRVGGLEPGRGYEFSIRERGDERDPAETNPGAVAFGAPAGVHSRYGYPLYWSRPLEPGARFWLGYYGLAVTAPTQGELLVLDGSQCPRLMLLMLRLPADDGEVEVQTWLWTLLPDDDPEHYAANFNAPELLQDRAYEYPPTAREGAEHAEAPGLRAAYRLLAEAIESMFSVYPPTISEELADAVADSCI